MVTWELGAESVKEEWVGGGGGEADKVDLNRRAGSIYAPVDICCVHITFQSIEKKRKTCSKVFVARWQL